MAMRRLIFVIVGLFFLEANAQRVMPGDHADPSVVKVGDTFWASATTSNWAPAYPLLSSKDLIHWEQKGYVFPELPEWADYYFWAPEISEDNGKIYIYYSAHRRGGNLCLGIASADKPEGPYTDHGPLMCEDVGSIDAFPMRDENGKLYLIWKQDGNSVGNPTPIWISEMNEERTELIGEKKELFRNDAPWESNLVEGVAMVRNGEYFYAFYAAAGCCGKDCTYATGIARARNLLGPWEKYEKNPVLTNDEEWKCPGHGTAITHNGKHYFLYHAYNSESSVYAGRQGLLREFEFTEDGWIRFLPVEKFSDVKAPRIEDKFDGPALSDNWQWSVFSKPHYEQSQGMLSVYGNTSQSWSYLGQKTFEADYRARVEINTRESTAEAGIALIGDEKNIVGATVKDGKIRIWKIQLGHDTLIIEKPAPSKERLFLEAKVSDGNRVTFRCSTNGKSFKTLNNRPINASFLPPWDRAIRTGPISRGEEKKRAVFESFILYH